MAQFTPSYWNPSRRGYAASVKTVLKNLENRPPTPGDVETPAAESVWARRVLGKVLTCDKFRLSKREAFEKYWANVKRTMYDSRLADSKMRDHQLLATREKVFHCVKFCASIKPLDIEFSDGKLTFPPGAWIGNLYQLADMCNLHPETVAIALRELADCGVIHYTSTWNGTIVQIIGFHVNRPARAFTSVRYDRRSIEASLHVVAAEPPPPKRGVYTPQMKADSAEARHKLGLPPRPPD